MQSKGDFWNEYIKVVDVEGASHFGKNLDAFWDALSAGGPGFPKGISELKLLNSSSLKTIDEGEFYSALVTIADDLRSCIYSDFVLHVE